MRYGLKRALLALACAVAFGVGPAQAVTIVDGFEFDQGIALDLSGATPCSNGGGVYSTNVGQFSGAGAPGSGAASCGDRTTVQVKSDTTPFPYGRFNPNGTSWLDSNDLSSVTWTIDTLVPLRGISFALTDAHDQANSYFSISVGGASWSIPDRLPNANLQRIAILFDVPVTEASILFETRLNDGYGVADVKLAPVPLPPALALMATGLFAFGAVRRRRRAAA